jgi:hypothetical protein
LRGSSRMPPDSCPSQIIDFATGSGRMSTETQIQRAAAIGGAW